MQLGHCSPIFGVIVLLASINCTIIIVEDAKGIIDNIERELKHHT